MGLFCESRKGPVSYEVRSPNRHTSPLRFSLDLVIGYINKEDVNLRPLTQPFMKINQK